MVYCKECQRSLKRWGSHKKSKIHNKNKTPTPKACVDFCKTHFGNRYNEMKRIIWEHITVEFSQVCYDVRHILSALDGHEPLPYLMGLIGDIQSGKTISLLIVAWYALFMSEKEYSVHILVYRLNSCKEDFLRKKDEGWLYDLVSNCVRRYVISEGDDIEMVGSIVSSFMFPGVEVELDTISGVRRVMSRVTSELGDLSSPCVPIIFWDEFHSSQTKGLTCDGGEFERLVEMARLRQVYLIGVSATWGRINLHTKYGQFSRGSPYICNIRPVHSSEFKYISPSCVELYYDNTFYNLSENEMASQAVSTDIKRCAGTGYKSLMITVTRLNNDQEDLVEYLKKRHPNIVVFTINQKTEGGISGAFDLHHAAIREAEGVVVVGDKSLQISVSVRPNSPIVDDSNRVLYGCTGMFMGCKGNTEAMLQSMRCTGIVPLDFIRPRVYLPDADSRDMLKHNINLNPKLNKAYLNTDHYIETEVDNSLYTGDRSHKIVVSTDDVNYIVFGTDKDKKADELREKLLNEGVIKRGNRVVIEEYTDDCTEITGATVDGWADFRSHFMEKGYTGEEDLLTFTKSEQIDLKKCFLFYKGKLNITEDGKGIQVPWDKRRYNILCKCWMLENGDLGYHKEFDSNSNDRRDGLYLLPMSGDSFKLKDCMLITKTNALETGDGSCQLKMPNGKYMYFS